MYLSARLAFLTAAGTLQRAVDQTNPSLNQKRKRQERKSNGNKETHILCEALGSGRMWAGTGAAEAATGRLAHRWSAGLRPAGSRRRRWNSGCRPPGPPLQRGWGSRPPQGWSRWSLPLDQTDHFLNPHLWIRSSHALNMLAPLFCFFKIILMTFRCSSQRSATMFKGVHTDWVSACRGVFAWAVL